MKKQPMQAGQRAKINIDGSPKPIPTCKSLFLLALNVPEGIAYVLKIESHAALKQARPLAAPRSEEMPVRALPRLVAVRTAERFLLQNLRMDRKRKYIKSAQQ
jgi:hypothetical protein